MRRAAPILGALLLLSTAGCLRRRAGYCNQSNWDCGTGFHCEYQTQLCVKDPPDAGRDATADAASDARVDTGSPPCDLDAHRCPDNTPFCDPDGICRSCDLTAQSCSTLNATTPICRPAGDGGTPATCVECMQMTDCHGTKPVCAASNTCVACEMDSDCATVGRAVCMQDGHCAGADEVVIVDENAGCSDGGDTGTFCTLASGVAALTPSRHVLIVVGGTSDRLTLATTNMFPIVVGRPNASGDPGSIPATTGTAITILSDTVLVRDVTVNLGSSANSRGVAISATSTSVQLLRVTASLGMGLGIDVEDGANATIDESYVVSNSVGGILINSATAVVQNTVLADNGSNNGYGIQFNNAMTGTKFWFNTVVNNPIAAICNLDSTLNLEYSIVIGPVSTCSLVDSVIVAPAFDSGRPYHLSNHDMCPTAPSAPFPNHDIDGDLRETNPDCGADQYRAN